MPTCASNEELSQEAIAAAAEELRRRFLQEPDVNGDKYERIDVQKIEEDDWYCQRFVLHQKGNVNDSLEMVKEALQWRKTFGVTGIKESSLPLEYFKAGEVFPYNRDNLGNPILMLAVKLHHKDVEMMEEHRRFLVYWIEKFEKEDSKKKMTVIFDCTNAGYSNLDLDMIRFIVNTFKNYYPWLLENILIFEMPWLFNAAWKIIKSWLSQDAVDRIKFVTKKTILEYVDAANLPVSMGGQDTHQYVYEPEEMAKSPSIKVEKGIASPKKSTKHKMSSEEFNPGSPRQGSATSRSGSAWDTATPQDKTSPEDKPTSSRGPRDSQMSKKSGGSHYDTAATHQDKSLVEVIPSSVLLFPHSESSENVNKTLTLKNVSSSCVAYKVKTNNIEAYRVRPPIGILKPGTSFDIAVQLMADHSCLPNDKLLLITTEVENEKISLGDLATLWATKPPSEQHEYRIRCKYGSGEMKPDTLKRVQSEIEKVHQKMSNVMLSTDSLKFQQRIMQLILILMVFFVIGLLWLTYSMALVMRHEPFGGICEHCGSILAALVCT